tara:strand:+ start:239 stop:1030 length:792 start_codon:yes stop_codon:yes gene_type:complete
MNDRDFRNQRKENIEKMSNDIELKELSREWCKKSGKYNFTYNFDWLGVPIIQFPNDMIAVQELIFSQKPDLIIETGVARGGSIIYSASLLALLDLRDALKNKNNFKVSRKVIGIDIDIRKHTHDLINKEALNSYINLVEGSSVESSTFEKVTELSKDFSNVMVLLDSNHTHEHVLKELNLYSKLVTKNGYLVVYDTSIEYDDDIWEIGSELNPNKRTWGPGNSPLSALNEFLSNEGSERFQRIKHSSDKLQISVCPEGFIKKI